MASGPEGGQTTKTKDHFSTGNCNNPSTTAPLNTHLHRAKIPAKLPKATKTKYSRHTTSYFIFGEC